ncbi:MAG TPA: BON domain-containing protein [Chitinophagaceae bacterium]|nr:BON domain-containing protein [Chitinophagaceae bacterium]
MKQKLSGLLLLVGAVTLISSTTTGCKSKVKDADVKTAVEAALRANPETVGLIVDVKDGTATVSGEVKDEAAKAKATELATGIKGVKSVENNVSIAAPPPAPAQVEITADDPLTIAVKDATKDYPTVTATVKDGVISVSGELKSDSWKKLKMALDGLRPKRVDASGLKISK